MEELEIENMMRENIGLVKKLTNEFFRRNNMQIEFEDFYSIALFGLYKACTIYDKDKGCFSTIAYITIRRELLKRIKTYCLKREKNYRTNMSLMEVLSLNDNDSPTTISDFLFDRSYDIEKQYNERETIKDVERELCKETPRNAYIIRACLIHKIACKDIALKFNITRSRVQQITSRFQKKIKNLIIK